MRKTTIAAWNGVLRPYRSLIRPHSGIVTVAPSRYAVTTQESWSIPPSSPTIVGSAVETIVWSSEASSIASSRPANVSRTRAGLRAPGSWSEYAVGARLILQAYSN